MQKETKNSLISAFRIEIRLRNAEWPNLIESGDMDRDTANLRQTSLQTALYIIEQGPTKPPTIQPLTEVLEELRRWQKAIQREATPATKNASGQRYRLLEEFITHYSPATEQKAPEQISLF